MSRISEIARACHEANRAICECAGDTSQKPWHRAEEWQRESAIKGVIFSLLNPDAPASAQHEAWMADKIADGWVYGPKKDAAAKTHPCLVSYDQLPFEQRVKDHVFRAIVACMPKEALTHNARHGLDIRQKILVHLGASPTAVRTDILARRLGLKVAALARHLRVIEAEGRIEWVRGSGCKSGSVRLAS